MRSRLKREDGDRGSVLSGAIVFEVGDRAIVHNRLNSIEVNWYELENLHSFKPENSARKASY